MRTFAAYGSASRLGLILATPLLALQALRLKADLYIAVNPFSLIVAILLALAGRRVIYITYEDFRRKALIHSYIPWGLRTVVGYQVVLLEQLLARISHATIVTQPDIQSRYARSMLIENAPLTCGPVIDEARRLYDSLEPHQMPTLVYAGYISRSRGLFAMLDVVAKLNEVRPWQLVLVGAIAPADHDAATAHAGWQYVNQVGCVSHACALAHIGHATFGLGLLSDVGGYSLTSMTKLYEYMFMETPFVVSDFKRWRESVRDLPAGLFVDPTQVESIARQINDVYEDQDRYRSMQKVGRQYIEQEFSWAIQSQPLHSLLQDARPGREEPSEA